MAAVATTAPPPAHPAGKQRSLGLMVLWMLFTCNIYWLFWLYKTYKEVRVHSPNATTVTPGTAVGFLFIPVFGFFWFIRIVVNLPRAIRSMQADHPQGEPLLPNAAVSCLLLAGFLFNLLSSLHPAMLLLGEAFLLSGLLLAQNALNQHWRCHLTGPVAAAAAPCSGLGDFMGARGPSLALGPAVAFLVAWLLSDLPAALRPAVFGGDWPSRWLWGHMLIDAVVLTVLLVSGLRLLASDFTAALLVSLAYGLLIGRMDVWVFHITSPVLRDSVLTALSILIWALFLFLALAVALRIIRTSWLALWIGSLVAFQLSQVASTVIGVYGWGSSFVLFPPLREVVTMLAAATVFALVFWGGSRLMPAAASSS